MNDVTTPGAGKGEEPTGTPTGAPAAAPADAPADASADAPADAPAPAAAPAATDAGTTAPAAGTDPVPAVAARPRKAGRTVLAALPFVLVLGAVGGAGAYTVATVDGADRTARTEVWQQADQAPGKDPAGDVAAGRHDTELSRLLLPVPDGYVLGPDQGAEGNDGETSGKKATAAMKEAGRGLAGKQRREFDRRIEKLKTQGVAVRTYSADSADVVIRTTITKMLDRKAVRETYVFQKGLMESVGLFRKGPTIEGHKHTTCFLVPGEKDDDGNAVEIDGMQCVAYDGELSVSVSAFGSKPFDKRAVAGLVKDQMDHIASPGEYI
ncbi:hypothetical protein [Streptomyces sp. NRRL WC-3549]|uniref:hypothetical protein n=1 Tax=Streptomyces sp. NRRL WC-3549 TaxID=1463925 RepID=UPI000A3F390A|nr:hypothetical protein [Streptomyces sp. NRRL WC-3549]